MELVTEKYKQTEVGLIPNDWEVKEFGELTEKIIGASILLPLQVFNSPISPLPH